MKNTKLTFQFDRLSGEERLRELILYISRECASDPTFGATKLNKILFFSDFASYFQTGKPITGVEYFRLEYGPAPKLLKKVRKAMIQNHELAVVEKEFFSKKQKRTIPLRKPLLEKHFKPDEIAFVAKIIRELWGMTATDVSELSHQLGWRIAAEEESIPYEASFLSEDPLTESDIEEARELNRKHCWEQIKVPVRRQFQKEVEECPEEAVPA
jgi:hypothetical protein